MMGPRMRPLLEQGAGLLALGVTAWLWLGIAESSLPMTLLSLVLLAALLAGLFFLARRGRRQQPVRRPLAWLLGIPVAWLLVHWVPTVEGFTLQAVSMVIRFTLAAVLTLFAWLTLLSIARARKPTPTPPA